MNSKQGNHINSWNDIFCCPLCYGSIVSLGKAHYDKEILKCKSCKKEFSGIAGTFDFTNIDQERELERSHYQQSYLSCLNSSAKNFDIDYWSRRWNDTHWPEGRYILNRLGDLDGKVVLCLGNGASVKELYFLTLGAKLICSDLSVFGVLAAKSKYKLGSLSDNVTFHAMDALRIPVKDHSLDIVYGYEFVHHLSDLNIFFSEVNRVLKPGGFCVFFDNAYSPLWQIAKKTFLWPFMKFSHLLYRRSPEDIRATYLGGYKESYLQEIASNQGLKNIFFDRLMFFQYIFTRGIGSIFGWKLPSICYRIPGTIGRYMDKLIIDHISYLKQNKIGLVWGFQN